MCIRILIFVTGIARENVFRGQAVEVSQELKKSHMFLLDWKKHDMLRQLSDYTGGSEGLNTCPLKWRVCSPFNKGGIIRYTASADILVGPGGAPHTAPFGRSTGNIELEKKRT